MLIGTITDCPIPRTLMESLGSLSWEEVLFVLEAFLKRSYDKPISFREKLYIDKVLAAADSTCGDPESKGAVLQAVQRLQFEYLPPLSSASYLTVSSGDIPANDISAPSSVGARFSDLNGVTAQNTAQLVGRTSSIFGVVPPDQLTKCILHRARSSMRSTTFRLYLEDEEVEGSAAFVDSRFLLGSKKITLGLSFQYYIWDIAEMKEWKEKSVLAKITKSNAVYNAKTSDQFDEHDEGSGTMVVAVRTAPEKLVHISAALALSGRPVDESVLSRLVEVSPYNKLHINTHHFDFVTD